MLYSNGQWFFVLLSCFLLVVVVGYQEEILIRNRRRFITVAEAEGGITLSNCPRNMTLTTERGESWTRVSWTHPTFLDRELASVFSTRTHNPGDRFPVGNNTVIYSVGLATAPICIFAVVVKDIEPPRIMNCPRDITIPADSHRNSASRVSWAAPLATDNVLLTSLETNYASGSSFTLGRTEVTYFAKDEHGNSAECSFSVYVTDIEEPVPIECPGDLSETVDPTETRKPVSWESPRFKDNSGTLQLSATHTRGQFFALGHTAVVYTASDLSGNTATCSFHVMLKVQVPNTRIFVRHYTMTEVEITWAQTMEKDASSYLIYVWQVGSSQPMPSDHVYYPINRQETFATKTLSGLSPGVTYNIRVVVTGIGLQLNTRQRTQPNIPARLRVMPSTLTSVSLTLIWEEGGGEFDQYQLAYRMIGSEILTTLRRLDKSATVYHLDGLDPGTAYVFKVSAISGTGETSTISSPRVLTVTTASLPTDKIFLTNVTSSSVSLLCRFSQDDRIDDETVDRGFVVLIYSNKEDVFTDVVFDAWPLKYTFKSLKPTTYYHIRVVSNEMGAYYETSITTRPDTVAGLRIESIDNSSLTLQWEPSTDHSYEITLAPNHQRIILPIRTSKNEVSFNHLRPKVTYSVTIVTLYKELRSDAMEMMVTPGVDEPTPVNSTQDLSCLGPLLSAACLAAIMLLMFLYIVKTCISSRGKDVHSHHAEENEYENPHNRTNSLYSLARYQNTTDQSSSTTQLDQLVEEEANRRSSTHIYPPLHLRIMPRRPKLRRNGYVADGLEAADDSPMYYNIPNKCELPD